MSFDLRWMIAVCIDENLWTGRRNASVAMETVPWLHPEQLGDG
jgi:hypothetical protein